MKKSAKAAELMIHLLIAGALRSYRGPTALQPCHPERSAVSEAKQRGVEEPP